MKPQLSVRLSDLSIWLGICFVLSCGMVLSLAFRPLSVLYALPLTEDGYYTLTIARYLSQGHVFSIDGAHKTTGFQPLWAVMTAPAFLFGSTNELAIRSVLLISGVIAVFSALAWSRLSQYFWQQDWVWHQPIFAALYLTQFQMIAQTFNGLETGLNLLIIACAGLLYVGAGERWTDARSILMGLVLGLSALCRIDNIVLVAMLCFAIAMREGQGWNRRVRIFLTLSLISALTFLPWPIYCAVVSGYPVPVSGLALGLDLSLAVLPGRIVNAGGALVRDIVPHIAGELYRPLNLVVVGVTALACWSIRLKVPAVACGANVRSRVSVFALVMVLFLALLVPFYVITNEASYFYSRYFVISAVFVLSAWTMLVVHCYRSAPAAVGLVLFLLVSPGWISVLGWHGLSVGQKLNSLQAYGNGPPWEQVRLAGEFQRDGQFIGAPQTGALGFFRDGVINLDGKVNIRAYQARREGKLFEYVLTERIELLIDYNVYLDPSRFPYFSPTASIGKYYDRVHPADPKDYDVVVLRRIRKP